MASRSRSVGMVTSLLLSLAAGCNTDPSPPPPPPPPIQPVMVEPSAFRLDVTQSMQLHLTMAPNLVGKPVTWSSSDPSVAVVTSRGVVLATAVGTAVITAAVGADSGKANVIVGRLVCSIRLPC